MTRALQRIPVPTRRPDRAPDGPARAPETSNAAAAKRVAATPATADEGYLNVSNTPATFKGFEAERFQHHDERIANLVAEFNKDKARFIGANPDQVTNIGDLDPNLVKSWMIQETGGGGKPWQVDPAQANNPGDWTNVKKTLGLSKPSRRNTGDADTNLRASISLLARKGFSKSGKPPSQLRGGQTFGGWDKALTNYNGNNSKVGGKRHKDLYAARIQSRAGKPDVEHRIPLGKKP